MKKSDMMKAQLETLKAEAKTLMDNAGATEEQINAKAGEISALKAKISLQEKLENEERANFDNAMNTRTAQEVTGAAGTEEVDEKEAYKQAFFAAIAGKKVTAEQEKMLIQNSLSSTSGTDGGYLIPVDQQTQIKELKRQYNSLETLVNVETVGTLTGSRVIEKEALYTPFANIVAEGDTITETNSPQFLTINYTIKDYAGILTVPNNLLNDTAALQAYLNKWLAKKDIATRNTLIVTLLNTLTKTAIAGIDDVKTVLNVNLDPSITAMSYVVMNQDAFNKFDKMKDSQGNYLLQPLATDPTKKTLAGKEVIVFSNKVLPTRVSGGNYAPVIIGNINEAITLFDRQAMSLLATNIGAGAFEKNQTKFRAILRLDMAKVDTSAVVFGEIVV